MPQGCSGDQSYAVVAGGGIGDGNAIARAIKLATQGVSMGTPFVASEEALTHRAYKERLVPSVAEHTVLGTIFDIWWPNPPFSELRGNGSVNKRSAGHGRK